MRLTGHDWPVAWFSDGEGEPVLLLNGLSSPANTWLRLRRQLSTSFRVLTIDNRGTGETGDPPGIYTMDVLANDALAVLDAAGESSAHVVGHSMGGLIAQELALRAPHRVRSLVLAATHTGIGHALPEEMAGGGELAAAASLSPEDRLAVLNGLLYAPRTSRELIAQDEDVRAAQPTSPQGYEAQLRGAIVWDRLSELPTLQMPTLVLHGESDRVVPVSMGKRLAATIPQAQLHLIPDTGHALFTDAETETADVIRSFIESVH